MGMFDTVHNSFVELGEDFLGPLQTKDLYNVMAHFWISPAGEIFEIDLLDVFKWVPDPDHRFGKREMTGNHGHVRAKRFSDYITVYPDRNITGSWKDEPVARLHIRNGRIESYTVTTQGDTKWLQE